MTAVRDHKSNRGALEPAILRRDFPLLCATASKPLHYLDNAATTHKPAQVIDAISACYREYYGPVHRGLYPLAEAASARYEQARDRIAAFIGAADARQLIFTRSTTEAINLVAQGWALPRLTTGDEIWISHLEHHANYLPWQRVCSHTGARLRVITSFADGTLDIDACAAELFGARSRLIAITQVSNVLGIVTPVAEICRRAGAQGIPVLVDAAQSVGHMPVDVANLNCDFLAFSAHKLFGPTGIGALYARVQHLDIMEPLLLGGGMVDVVGEAGSAWLPWPQRFEAGSPNLADASGFAAAVAYIEQTGLDAMQAHVSSLARELVEALSAIPGVQVYGGGSAGRHSGIVAFNLSGVHPHDLAQIAGEQGVAIRAGHHCSQPLMRFLGTHATARASLAPYNTREDIQALVAAIHTAKTLFT